MRYIHTPEPTAAEIHQLTANDNPDEVWAKAVNIIRHISPKFDLKQARVAFVDVLYLFRGEYPGYSAIKTPYHDLHHTLDVLLCAMRLMHGVHLSGTPIADHEINLIILATLFHDIGYAQLQEEDTGSSGAQFTLTHVGRGIEFMKVYLKENNYPENFAIPVACLMDSTNPGLAFDSIEFPDQRTRMLAQIVGSADIVGQMSDRTYLEKLLFLYLEFKEAGFGNYTSMHDLLRQTKDFYDDTKEKKLDGTFEGIYKKLSFHFKDFLGTENNYYIDSIENNIKYLSRIITLNEEKYFAMLKRGGIIEKSQNLVEQNSKF